MDLRGRVTAGLARQLGEPRGWRGRLVGRGLNRGNRAFVTAAVNAADTQRGDRVADLGFGGGIGLELLLNKVGPTGHVAGVDISATMLRAAARKHRDQLAGGLLSLHEATMLELPLADAELDAIITVNTLYFVEDAKAAFVEAARVLRRGGRYVAGIGEPAAMAAMPVTAHGFRLRPVAELTQLLSGAGFGTLRAERVGSGDSAAHLLIGLRS